MTKDPLVSVKMLTYNHEPYIAQSIEGVVNQKTDFPFELVIGEDCSTDDTRRIVFDFQRKYPDIIRVITSEKNVGVHNNSLRTEQACRGKYIAYCEGDDYWHHSLKLQTQISFMEDHSEYGMVHSNSNRYIVKDKILQKDVVTFTPEYDDSNAYFDILTENRSIWTATVCVRKDLLFKVLQKNPECTDKRYLMGDDQRWLEISRLTKIRYFHESFATYNVLTESASRGADLDKAVRFQLSAKEIRYHYLSKYYCPDEVAKQTKYCRIIKLLRVSITAKNTKIATEQILELRSLGFKPPLKDHILYLGCKNQIYSNFVSLLRSVCSFVKMLKRIKLPI